MLEKSLQFLWAVRNQLHLLSKRKQDDLTFELQEKIAPMLGFPPGTEGIEEMIYEITQTLTDHGCDIHFARISTLGNRIVDVFYVQDTLGETIEGKQKTDQLKEVLLSRLTRWKEMVGDNQARWIHRSMSQHLYIFLHSA